VRDGGERQALTGILSLWSATIHYPAVTMNTPSNRADLLRVIGPGLLLGLTACVATTDITKAPFRATTHLSEATTDASAVLTQGTTQATKDLTKPFKELILHMAPGADAKVTRRLEVVAFAIVNHENLRIDIARGGGDYLESFAHLIGLPAARHADFFETAQSRYSWMYADTITPVQSLDRLLGEYYDPGWKVGTVHEEG